MNNEKNKFDATKYKNDFQKKNMIELLLMFQKDKKFLLMSKRKKKGIKV